MDGLIDALGSQIEGDMERFACSEAADCMQAYYEVKLHLLLASKAFGLTTLTV